MSKLTTEERDTMKHWLHQGVKQSEVALVFGVSRAYVSQVNTKMEKEGYDNQLQLPLDTQ